MSHLSPKIARFFSINVPFPWLSDKAELIIKCNNNTYGVNGGTFKI